MTKMQAEIIAALGVKETIDPKQEIARRVQFIKDYLQTTGMKTLVLGISGGQDSSLAGRLAQLAVEELRAETGEAAYRFIAVRLPYGEQADEADAMRAINDFIHPDQVDRVNIKAATDAMVAALNATDEEISDFNKGNIKARMRMIAQYAIAGEHNYLVIGTDHGAESVTGFFTKYGDGGADVLPLFGLDKRQNRLLAKTLGAEERLWAKAPTADLLDDAPGQTDEAELGLSYDDIDDYLEGREVADAVAEQIEHRWRITRHKRTTPATILDDWWRS